MKMHVLKLAMGVALLGAGLTGCATKPYDYTNFRAHPPRSILVLPPLNQSTDVGGTYSYLSTVSQPIAEMGYYVFPVAVVDRFFKENGMPTAGEMHQAPLDKVRDILGADAVLYVTLTQYGTKYRVLSSVTVVVAACKLVDTQTGTVLWEGTISAQDSSGGSGNLLGDLIAAAITQAINNSIDHGHEVARMANQQFRVKNYGLLYGPYSPEYGKK